jgi:nickel-dependent lactate racemase
MKCDLKIGIGSIVPHIMAGFGGGGKLILPGVAAYESILAFHSPRNASSEGNPDNTVSNMGLMEGNPRRRDIDEVAEIVGLDMKIDAVVNMWGETVALFAGKPQPAYAAALEEAKSHYLTPQAKDRDIVIANTYAKANEAVTGLLITFPSVAESGGDVVLIANIPEGQITHYLMGPFGNDIGGALALRMKVPANVKRLIIFNEYPEFASRNYIEDTDKVIMMDKWEDVLALLKQSHGNRARVAVYPNADIQYCGG